MLVATQIPNIYNAFTDKDGGIATGLLETGKGIAKVGLDTAGFMIGQALIPIPFIGGMIGCMATSWLGEKILGKSFTDQKAEAEGKQTALPSWTPYTAQGGTPSFNGSSGFVAPQSTLSQEQLMQIHRYLNRGINA